MYIHNNFKIAIHWQDITAFIVDSSFNSKRFLPLLFRCSICHPYVDTLQQNCRQSAEIISTLLVYKSWMSAEGVKAIVSG